MLFIFRIGSQIPVPGIDREYWLRPLTVKQDFLLCLICFRRSIQPVYDFCAEHNAVYNSDYNIPAPDHSDPFSGEAGKGRYGRAKKDSPVYTIPYGAAGYSPGHRSVRGLSGRLS